MQKIRIDFDNPGLPPHLDVMESDAQSRFFELTLFRSGAVYTAPDGASYSLMYRGFGPQNQGWYDTITDQAGTRPALVVDSNKITCEIAPQAMVVPGHLDVVLCVSTASGYMLKSWPIDVNVRNDHYDDTAETAMYFNLSGDFTAKIAELNTAMNALDNAVAKAETAVEEKKNEALKEVAASTKAASDAAGAAQLSQQAAASSASAAGTSEQRASTAAGLAESSKKTAIDKAAAALKSADAAATSASVAKEYLEQVKTITTGAQGWYATPAALQSAVPIGENGWFAFVGTTDTIWTWDSDTSAWVDTGATSRLAEYYTRDQVDAMLAAQRLKDHPVGSPFWTITDEDPNVTIGGTWVKIAENRAIMGASEDHPAGTTVEAGLPNIEGTIDSCDFGRGFKSAGAFTLVGGTSGSKQNYLPNSSESWVHYYPQISLSAATSNPIYGASDTVQPAAYYFNIWIRTA